MDEDIRWKQRFENYKKALVQLTAAVMLAENRELSELEQQGLVKAFEFTFELSWNVMKDFLTSTGFAGIIGSKNAIRQAFTEGLIPDGQIWMNMIDDRNAATHTYDEDTKDDIVLKITEKYYAEFVNFSEKMEGFL
jgi:nucleotidyltransferase substrate binding protein (TIGR01987 family)